MNGPRHRRAPRTALRSALTLAGSWGLAALVHAGALLAAARWPLAVSAAERGGGEDPIAIRVSRSSFIELGFEEEPPGEPAAEPVAALVVEPQVEPLAEPIAEPVAEPVAAPVIEPVAEAAPAAPAAPVALAEPVAAPADGAAVIGTGASSVEPPAGAPAAAAAPVAVAAAALPALPANRAGLRESAGGGGGGAQRAARLTSNPKPAYPRLSIRYGEQGEALCRLEIDAEGRVVGAKIARSSGHARLDEAALSAVKRWRFEPATRDGVPEPSFATLPVVFRIQDAR
jgi:periplasmic protein TonB